MADLILRGERVLLPSGVEPATIVVHAGRIVAVEPFRDPPAGVPVVDAGPLVVLPGLVDSHVHLNDPGRADWEGFDSGTRAAAAGGVTTLVDMPLNSVPATVDVPALEQKRHAADGRCWVDVGFWGGVVPGNTASLTPLAQRGVLGFKCFLSPSGVGEFEPVIESHLRQALPALAELGLPLLVHAELPAALLDVDRSRDPRAYRTWLDSRPPASEHAAIDLMIRLAREYKARVHIVHLASADGVERLRRARRDGVAITVETCPHYLTFDADQIRDGATAFKCAPPIRERHHRDGLWQALAGGDIDLIVSDHSPAPPGLKGIERGDFVTAWGGIASLQLGLPVVWTDARRRGLSLEHVARWMCTAPARLAGLDGVKGALATGHDADFVLFDPDATGTVDPAALFHRHPITPYAGMSLNGRVHTTILRGDIIYEQGALRGVPRGRQLLSVDCRPEVSAGRSLPAEAPSHEAGSHEPGKP